MCRTQQILSEQQATLIRLVRLGVGLGTRSVTVQARSKHYMYLLVECDGGTKKGVDDIRVIVKLLIKLVRLSLAFNQ